MELQTPPPPITSPAGWYPDPAGYGQRYWDGRQWSGHVAPMAYAPAPQPEQKAPAGDWIGGVLISLLMPLIGFIVGIVYTVKGGPKRDVGILCLVLSVAAFLFWLAVMASGSSSGSGY